MKGLIAMQKHDAVFLALVLLLFSAQVQAQQGSSSLISANLHNETAPDVDKPLMMVAKGALKTLPVGKPALASPAPPGASVTIGPVTFAGSHKFRFSLHAFELGASAASDCTASVTATTVNQKTVQNRLNATLVTPLPTGSVAVPVLYSGFKQVVVYTVAVATGACPLSSGEQYTYTIFATLDTTSLNPRIARCEANCFLSLTGYWPFGSDPVRGGGDSTSDFFLVNVTPTTDATKEVTFCSWLTPLSSDPNNPPTFNKNTRTLPVKFQVALINHTCPPATLSDTVPDAQVIISVARIKDALGNDVIPLDIRNPLPSGSSRTLPLFSFDPTSLLYTYTLDLSGYASGLYSVTATFITSNTTAETTFFRIR